MRLFKFGLYLFCLINAINAKPISKERPKTLQTSFTNEKNDYIECMTKGNCNKELNAPSKEVACLFCDLVLPSARKLIRKNETKHWHAIATFFCTELKIEDYDVCNQVSLLYSVTEKF
jgi:hypothetical protein